jgi:putative IMPACT (imprinted ancient) family translation regulator
LLFAGETGAGPKLLRVLVLMRAANVCCVVSRWYGGVKLGPDRFRHICNAARSFLTFFPSQKYF